MCTCFPAWRRPVGQQQPPLQSGRAITLLTSSASKLATKRVQFAREEADDAAQKSLVRKSQRKGTPWHGGGAQTDGVHFAPEEADEAAQEPSVRKSQRKGTPWHGGGAQTDGVHFGPEEADEAAQETFVRKSQRRGTPWQGGAQPEDDVRLKFESDVEVDPIRRSIRRGTPWQRPCEGDSAKRRVHWSESLEESQEHVHADGRAEPLLSRREGRKSTPWQHGAQYLADHSSVERRVQVSDAVEIEDISKHDGDYETAELKRSSVRKSTPWHAAVAGGADVKISDEVEIADIGQHEGSFENTEMKRSSARKSTPWHGGVAVRADDDKSLMQNHDDAEGEEDEDVARQNKFLRWSSSVQSAVEDADLEAKLSRRVGRRSTPWHSKSPALQGPAETGAMWSEEEEDKEEKEEEEEETEQQVERGDAEQHPRTSPPHMSASSEDSYVSGRQARLASQPRFYNFFARCCAQPKVNANEFHV